MLVQHQKANAGQHQAARDFGPLRRLYGMVAKRKVCSRLVRVHAFSGPHTGALEAFNDRFFHVQSWQTAPLLHEVHTHHAQNPAAPALSKHCKMSGCSGRALCTPAIQPSTMTPLPEGVQRVAAELLRLQHPHAPRMLDDACRTAQQAAGALGIEVGQVAKSIIFRREADDAAVLVITSGDRRVDQAKLEALVGPLGRADAAFVKARTGFSIGGVAPLAHARPGVTLIDRELLRFEVLWAAAGHPHAVFALSPQDLERLTGAPLADVTETPKSA